MIELTDTALPLLASTGLIDWGNQKIADTTGLIRNAAYLVAVILLLLVAWKSRGAIGAILVAGLSVGVFVWLVLNTDALVERTDQEVNAAAVQVTDRPGADLPPSTVRGGSGIGS